jgi:hypothetical protein
MGTGAGAVAGALAAREFTTQLHQEMILFCAARRNMTEVELRTEFTAQFGETAVDFFDTAIAAMLSQPQQTQPQQTQPQQTQPQQTQPQQQTRAPQPLETRWYTLAAHGTTYNIPSLKTLRRYTLEELKIAANAALTFMVTKVHPGSDLRIKLPAFTDAKNADVLADLLNQFFDVMSVLRNDN